jgi:superfamily I DNA/RNA helicase
MRHLEGLNAAQKEAVLATAGPIMVLAGAGSGKTRVLTSRIYHLILRGTPPGNILAITFTNKAAREMRERLGSMLGEAVAVWKKDAVPFVATFHGLGRELLEAYGAALGVPRHFTIFDRDDSERAIKNALKELGVDPKEVAPRLVLARISKAKGEGKSREEYGAAHAREGFIGNLTKDAWRLYEEALAKEKALDFDDLILLPVKLLTEHADVRAKVQERFRYLHVDEYQDTSVLQGRLVRLLAGDTKNVFVVGDIDQCLVKGTTVRLADGSEKKIESIQKGDFVLSNYGSGSLRPARVTKAVRRTFSGDLIRITTRSGRELESTPEHVHFAGYRLGLTPQLYFTYLMHKKGKGWRLGVSQTYTNGQRLPMLGFKQRCNQEHGDEVWVVGTYATTQEARINEYLLSLTYKIPTLPFIARKGTNGGYVHDQAILDSIFTSFDTDTGARQLLKDRGLSKEFPHHRAKATRSDRRNIVVTLCGERRGVTPMHRISIVGSDIEGRTVLVNAGFSVRPAKTASMAWRFETAHADFGTIREKTRALLALFPDAYVGEYARFGGKKARPKDGNSLPLLPASSVAVGMAVFNEETGYDIVERVERIPATEHEVFDIDVEKTHNFIANGIHTHNCIYTWRQATIENLLAFADEYENAKTIVLEHNYRSSKTIVDAANQIIEKNRNRKEKRSVTDNAPGEPIRIHMAGTSEEEARFIAREAASIILNGTRPEDIAVLYRTNFQSRVIEEAFLSAGLPYRLLGTQFYDRKEVKDVLAWTRLALDPSREADRMRAVQSPSRGIGKVTLGKLAEGARDALKPGERMKVEVFEATVKRLKDAATTLTPSEFVRLTIEESGMRAAFEKGGDDDLERLENAKELATIASRHDMTPGEEGIAAFLADAALAGDQDELDRKKEKKGVTLMTVHAAKGLEFSTVFIAGLEEGLFPHEGMSDEERDEEEERRLFYVAVTRAKARLYLTLARVRRIYGTDYLQDPSSFLNDIDASLVKYAHADEEEAIIEL